MSDKDTQTLEAMRHTTRMHTITFHYPKTFPKAVAASLGRIGDEATHWEVEEFIRGAVKANIECLMQEHLNRRSTLKARISKRLPPVSEPPSSEPTLKKKLKARLRRT